MPSAEWYAKREARDLPRAIAAFRAFVSLPGRTEPLLVEAAVAERQREIDALPDVEFKGRALKATTCTTCGKQRNLFASRLWLVVSVARVICPWCLVRG